jgi:hypothetical protein
LPLPVPKTRRLETEESRQRRSPRARDVAGRLASSRCIIGVSTPENGVFALGTASHAYLKFDLSCEQEGSVLVNAIAALREPRTTMDGVNLFAEFRPELWPQVVPDDAPEDVASFNQGRGARS